MKARRNGADLERARDVEPFLAHAGDAERGVDQHRPERADEDHEDRREAGILDGVERERHPGERRDRLQHLDERIERAAHQRRHADQEADRDRDQHGEQIADADARDRIGELDADALVVRAVVVERAAQVLPELGADIERARHRRLALRRGRAHQLGVFRIHLRDRRRCRASRGARRARRRRRSRPRRRAARSVSEAVMASLPSLAPRTGRAVEPCPPGGIGRRETTWSDPRRSGRTRVSERVEPAARITPTA